jgi:hypothetical protein
MTSLSMLGVLLSALTGCATEKAAADSAAALDAVAGRCEYTNPFSDTPECKAYTGAGWTAEGAEEDCTTEPIFAADPGVFTAGEGCGYESELGQCVIDGGEDSESVLHFPGEDAGACSDVELGCSFAAGEFVGGDVCEGGTASGGDDGGNVFLPFEQVCAAPLEGEPEGASEGGEVCTWEAISGCTEEGRRFVDYASCDPVLTQRPYVAYEVSADTPADDARLSDEGWLEELGWVTEQVEACACVCCHSSEISPEGASGWYLEADPIWLDTVDDDGLAMLAGWIDSTAFGAFPPEENNGFDRDTTGLPTTDVARMKAFLEGELERRGLEEEDFADAEPFGGPLYDQLTYDPEGCEDGEGIDRDGVVTWSGGGARYLYLLEPGSDSPGVPPNLDLPEGTLWRLDVSPDAAPVESGITYGSTPDGTSQHTPAQGAPPALVSGQTYYLYALADIYQPLTRCLFTY